MNRIPIAGALSIALVAISAASCGGSPKRDAAARSSAAVDDDPAARYAPLEVGADWRSYTRVNRASFESPTHGHRWVDVYVNPIGLAAYRSDAPFPVGTVIVKSSREAADGKPTEVAGPLFVMAKREAGFAPDHDDWWYGLHWEAVPPSWQSRMGGAQVYWRSPSPRADYCWGCHESYDRNVGLPPVEQRDWSAPAAAGG
jgi:hypothetical protein